MGNQVTQMDKNELLEQHTSTSSKTFPKTTIISISTHGEIRLNKEITNASDIQYDANGLAYSVLPTFQINPNIKENYYNLAIINEKLSNTKESDRYFLLYNKLNESEKEKSIEK